jgi:hypothetical protein
VIASNLGLLDRLIPVPVKPVGGTVKAVDLTASEQSRVPEAAKAKPLPVNPIQSGTEQATQPIPNASSPGVLSGNTPKTNRPTPKTSASQNPPTNKPGIMPKPSNTVKKNDPRYKVDRNNKFPGITAKPDGSSDQNDQPGSRGGKNSRGTQEDQTKTDQQNQNPGEKPNQGKPTPTPTPTTTSTPSPSPPEDKFAQERKNLEREAKGVVNSFRNSKVKVTQLNIPNDIQQTLQSRTRKYRPIKVFLWVTDVEKDGVVVLAQSLSRIQQPSKSLLVTPAQAESDRDRIDKVVNESYDRLSKTKKLEYKDQVVLYEFNIPVGE